MSAFEGRCGSGVDLETAFSPEAPQRSARRANAGSGAAHVPLNPPEARYTDSCLSALGKVEHTFTGAGLAPGNLWFGWIHGSEVAARNRDPRIQVMQFNEDTYVLRQNICVDWRGAFTYLLFGNEGALLIDTGATLDPHLYPLRPVVEALLTHWQTLRRRRNRASLRIVLTSAEDADQNAGAVQFAGMAGCMQVKPKADTVENTAYQPIDLGGRVVDVIATPGTHRDGFTFYDRYTGLLFTGDFLFPGRILIANERDYLLSLQRLLEWKNQHPVKWLLGGHVDMQFIPGRAYGRFATFKPFERELQLSPEVVDDVLRAAKTIAGRPGVLARKDFWLLHDVGPDERPENFAPDLPNISPARPV